MAQAQEERLFTDEKTRRGWEIAEKASRLSHELPPEREPLRTEPIKFDGKHKSAGMTAVLVAGTVVFTGKNGVILVPRRTVDILETLGIPYQTVAEK